MSKCNMSLTYKNHDIFPTSRPWWAFWFDSPSTTRGHSHGLGVNENSIVIKILRRIMFVLNLYWIFVKSRMIINSSHHTAICFIDI